MQNPNLELPFWLGSTTTFKGKVLCSQCSFAQNNLVALIRHRSFKIHQREEKYQSDLYKFYLLELDWFYPIFNKKDTTISVFNTPLAQLGQFLSCWKTKIKHF